MNTPPAAQLPESLLGYYAGFVTRLSAFVIDVVLVSITIFFVSWFVSTTLEMLQGQIIINSLVNAIPLMKLFTDIAGNPLTYSVVSVLFILGYYLFFWTTIGQTPGKFFMGIRVVTTEGRRLKLGRSLLRYLGYYLSGLSFGLGFLWILFDDERRGWHDRIAGTCVIYVWDARPDENFLVRISEELLHRREALRNIINRQRRLRHPPGS